MTRLGDAGVSDSAFDAAAAVFGEKQLVDLTIAIGLMNVYNRIAISFRATPRAVAEGESKARTHQAEGRARTG